MHLSLDVAAEEKLFNSDYEFALHESGVVIGINILAAFLAW